MTTAAIRTLQAGDIAGWQTARALVQDYAVSLGIDLSFQGFEHELDHLAHEYGPPAGAFLLADRAGAAVGCVGIRRFDDDTAEMKRLYVSPAGRGLGIGRRLAAAAIESARGMGYHRLVLDTLPSMEQARALYRSLGFVEIPAYRFNPVEGTAFLELTLE